jgi:hypothetical protein
MTDVAIRVENLSKQYRIGGPQASYKTIRESLTEAVQIPFRRLSSILRGQSSAVTNETIWALKDVSFDACPELSRRVQRGEVVGIPSLRQAQYKRRAQDKHWAQRGFVVSSMVSLSNHQPNGGEDDAYFDRLSTRLKVLSRITEPTKGYAETSS